ncbi:MAG: ice-binding family protein, partial [Candidatus Cloacimonadaceae bacterium]|nr:ice-binding family protein [Candidatus Cloacimonadaceae bacterium]
MKKTLFSIVIALLMITFVYGFETPVNLEITHDGTNVILSWDAVIGARFYKVFVCDTPYGVFELDETGMFLTSTSWTKQEPAPHKFYNVAAVSGPEPVLLGTAGNYVLLAKAAISSATASSITGDVGISPAAASYITGFGLILDPSGVFSISTQVDGQIFAADYTPPTPTNLTVAVLDMQTAYVDAAGRPTPDFVNLNSGNISGLTLVPGLYNWDGAVSIASTVYLDGGQDDVWIFQIAGSVVVEPNVSIILGGSAKASNVFWQTFGPLVMHSGSHLEGNVLCSTAINLDAGASVNGRLLSQTAITLNQNT